MTDILDNCKLCGKGIYYGSPFIGIKDGLAHESCYESREKCRIAECDLLAEKEDEVNILIMALIESIALQNHYAGLLNQYDPGDRRQFKSLSEWISRLKIVGIIDDRVLNSIKYKEENPDWWREI